MIQDLSRRADAVRRLVASCAKAAAYMLGMIGKDETDADIYHVAMNETDEQWVRVISYENLPGSRRPRNVLRA